MPVKRKKKRRLGTSRAFSLEVGQIQYVRSAFAGAIPGVMQNRSCVARMSDIDNQKIAIVHHCPVCGNDGGTLWNVPVKGIIDPVKTGRKGDGPFRWVVRRKQVQTQMREVGLRLPQNLCRHPVKLPISSNIELLDAIGGNMPLNGIAQQWPDAFRHTSMTDQEAASAFYKPTLFSYVCR